MLSWPLKALSQSQTSTLSKGDLLNPKSFSRHLKASRCLFNALMAIDHWQPMPKPPLSWIRSQHPLTQCNLRKWRQVKQCWTKYLKIQCCGPAPHPYVFGPTGTGFVSQRYGSPSFYHQAKIVRKPWFLLFCDFFMTFYLWKMMKIYLQKVS